MPVFDFSSAATEKTEDSVCTYTTFASDENTTSPEQPILVLANSVRQWKHHSCGVFSNPEKKTAFEFQEEDGVLSADILKVDARFVSLIRWLGDNHIHVRLSGQNTSGGYAVYKIRETAFGGGTKLSAEDGFLQFMIERLLSSNAPEEEAEDEDSVITTFNSHRITSPITAEVDTTSGQTICYGLYALNAASCQYIDPTEEELALTGLDDPYCRISFKYGGKARVLLLGNEIRSTDDSDDSSGSLSKVTGYYAMFEGDRLIYAISTANAPWYTFKVEDIMSRRPISPYIYTVDTLTVTTPDGEYKFTVDGDSDNHTFYYGSEALDETKFKSFYQHLITSMGEELFFEDSEYEPYITVKFEYRPEYESTYGRLEDTLEFYKSDDRKSIVRVNGDVLYKVREVYTERLLSNLDALLNGGDIQLNW